jgi:hypothetical protein
MLFSVIAYFPGKLVKGLKTIFGPSTWQEMETAFTAKELVCLLGGLGEPRRLSMTMLASCV